jgi:hypothetical protein
LFARRPSEPTRCTFGHFARARTLLRLHAPPCSNPYEQRPRPRCGGRLRGFPRDRPARGNGRGWTAPVPLIQCWPAGHVPPAWPAGDCPGCRAAGRGVRNLLAALALLPLRGRVGGELSTCCAPVSCGGKRRPVSSYPSSVQTALPLKNYE